VYEKQYLSKNKQTLMNVKHTELVYISIDTFHLNENRVKNNRRLKPIEFEGIWNIKMFRFWIDDSVLSTKIALEH